MVGLHDVVHALYSAQLGPGMLAGAREWRGDRYTDT